MMETIANKKEKHYNSKSISLRSEEVKEILGKPPSWIVQWGICTIFFAILLVITGSGFFRYPDIVRAPAIITKANPPSTVIAKVQGKAEAIFISDGEIVKKGDTLAVLENPARYNDIFLVSNYVRSLNNLLNSLVSPNLSGPPYNIVLGEVQPAYNQYSRAWSDFDLFVNQNLYERKIISLKAEMYEYLKSQEYLTRQRDLAGNDLKLTASQHTRDSMLFSIDVISATDFERTQALLLVKQQSLENMAMKLSDAKITIERLNQRIADTEMEREKKYQNLYTDLINAFRQLESSLAEWKNKYLLISPVSGKLNYLSVWSNLQELKAGDPVFSITPEDMGDLYARIILPFRGAGKVNPGQRVNIKLDGYPYMEFGMVEGRIQSVSGGPVENGFPAVISLNGGSVTSFGYEIDVVRELPGTAEISTDEISLLARLIYPFRHLIVNRRMQ